MQTIKSYVKNNKKVVEEYDFYRKKSMMRQIDNALQNKALLEEQKEVLNEYYMYISTGIRVKSLNSVLSVVKSIRWFAEFLKKPFNEVSKDDVIGYIHYKRRKGNGDNHINQCL